MLTQGYYPKGLLKSTIIFIPKDTTATLSASHTYCVVPLFNSICKLFDHAIIDMCEDTYVTIVICSWELTFHNNMCCNIK